ncbi:phosphopantetheine-binding protein [Streptomyces sp. NPDC020330]|uniref:phosphopantetheine-binding protein n=1 Tax=unclassified Streptomyces TaxID=2593676 RepID=UPI0037BE15EE
MTTELSTVDAETALRELFSEILELPPQDIGTDDDFFHLGGHSQLAIRLAARIRTRLGVKISVPDVFAAPTVAELAVRAARAPKAPAPLTRRVSREP